MNDKLKRAISNELKSGKASFENNNFEESFYFFERAHVLGQKDPYYHVLSHVWMLKLALKQKNIKEIAGQLFRIPSGFIGSVIGWVPTGNTGGSKISPFKKMPIPSDLQIYLDS